MGGFVLRWCGLYAVLASLGISMLLRAFVCRCANYLVHHLSVYLTQAVCVVPECDAGSLQQQVLHFCAEKCTLFLDTIGLRAHERSLSSSLVIDFPKPYRNESKKKEVHTPDDPFPRILCVVSETVLLKLLVLFIFPLLSSEA